MQIITTYKRIKHAYVKVSSDGNLHLSLPRWARFDTRLRQQLITKGKQLLSRKSTHRNTLSRMTHTHVRIWGELVEKAGLPENIEQYLKDTCHAEATHRADYYSKQINKPYKLLRIRKVRSKRGSCSSKGNITINFDLIHLSPHYLQYVVAHEVCHLIHPHHQASFRNAVEQLLPDYTSTKKELQRIHLLDATT